MPFEIERKYLVQGNFQDDSSESFHIRQGYLSGEDSPSVRIRIRDDKAFITVKGKKSGITGYEWEKEIGLEEAKELLLLCRNIIIEKRRYLVPWKDLLIEVDKFEGLNRGLIVAEIEMVKEMELKAEHLPPWIGEEVSYDPRYQNSSLSRHPFTSWKW